MEPRAETSATADPEIPPNSIEANTFTTPSPPLIAPTADEANLTSLTAIPPWNINSPAKIKNGIASREKTFMPEIIL